MPSMHKQQPAGQINDEGHLDKKCAKRWRSRPYGCGAALGGKRVSRDPFSRAYKVNVDECPAMAELMVFCGPGYFQQRLPWDE